MNSAYVISVSDLGKRFGELVAVQRLSFRCVTGEIFGLVGPDGAGKTTIMRLLAGIMPPDTGSILIEGIDVVADPRRVKAHISYMPQRFGLYDDLTVEENIDFFADLFEIDRKIHEERMTRLLSASGMAPFRKRLAGQLSGGMKQKLGLACALIHAPKVLLLDEPSAGVDPVSRRDFWRILYQLHSDGVTIVLATSYLDEAERCTRLGLLHDGRMLHCDSPDALKKLMPGELVSIISSQPRIVHDAVETLGGVISALLVGESAHVVVDNAQRRIVEIKDALNARDIPFERVERIPPSIEDLFVSLVTGSARTS